MPRETCIDPSGDFTENELFDLAYSALNEALLIVVEVAPEKKGVVTNIERIRDLIGGRNE